MSFTPPENVPAELIAGDLWSWTRTLADYPAPTWTLTYYFENSANIFKVTATASGTSFAASIAAATTGGYKAGRYRWQARVTNGSESYTLGGDDSGWLDVKPDPAAEGKYDHRSWARRCLDAIEAVMEGRASTDQQAVSIQGRSISRMTYAELSKWRSDLRAEVRTDEQSASGGNGRQIKVRLNRV